MTPIFIRSSSQANLLTKPRGKSPLEKYEDAKATLSKYYSEYSLMNKSTKTAEKKLIQIEKLESKLPDLEKNKDNPNFSKSFINECLKIFIKAKYNRYRSIDNKFTRKGTKSESSAIQMYSMFKGKLFIKNDERLYNEEYLVTGEPDLFEPKDPQNPLITEANETIDIKCSWDIASWHDSAFNELKKIYEYQGHDYMLLTGAKRHTVAFVLIDTPFEQVRDEIRKETFKYDGEGDDLPVWMAIETVSQHVYTKSTFDKYIEALFLDPESSLEAKAIYESFVEIPYQERIFEITFDRDESVFEQIKEVNYKAKEFIEKCLMTGLWKKGIHNNEETEDNQ